MNKLIAIATLALLPLSGTNAFPDKNGDIPHELIQFTERLKQFYAPDNRVEIFDIHYSLTGKELKIQGTTTSDKAKKALMDELVRTGYSVTDHLKVLPDERKLDGRTYGIINLSVCNMRSTPSFRSPMTTQALMGMPVRLLDKEEWYQVQTPDKYIAWVHRNAVHPVSRDEIHQWNLADKIVVTASYGIVYSKPDEQSMPVSDVVAGNRLKEEGRKGRFYQVEFPDGRTGFISKKAAMPEAEWRKGLTYDAGSILKTACRFMGIPYLWAGLSTKAVDCSGLICNVLFLHDVVIPRDADQQADAGESIDIDPDFGNLQPGDLLLFGNEATPGQKECIDHIGFYLGGKRFIHSQGYVHISSLDPDDPLFDPFNLDRLLHASRIIPYINRRNGLSTTDRQEHYLW